MSQQNNTPSVESELNELDKMVAWFEGETFTLDEAVDHYQEAQKLAVHIESRLAELKNEVTVLKKKFDQAE
jgi:exodeoxyribonuclease VII small subunit